MNTPYSGPTKAAILLCSTTYRTPGKQRKSISTLKREGIMKFRKRPVEIEAIQVPFAIKFKNLTSAELANWLHSIPQENNDFIEAIKIEDNGEISIETLEGKMIVRPGDVIIKGVAGEFYPCKPDIFVKTHEPVTDD